MTTSKCVLGVQGCVGLWFAGLHTISPLFSWLGGDCVGCVGLSRTRAHTHENYPVNQAEKNIHATPEKAYTPCTPYTFLFNLLNSLGFKCVGFVLGMSFLCRVWFLGVFK